MQVTICTDRRGLTFRLCRPNLGQSCSAIDLLGYQRVQKLLCSLHQRRPGLDHRIRRAQQRRMKLRQFGADDAIEKGFAEPTKAIDGVRGKRCLDRRAQRPGHALADACLAMADHFVLLFIIARRWIFFDRTERAQVWVQLNDPVHLNRAHICKETENHSPLSKQLSRRRTFDEDSTGLMQLLIADEWRQIGDENRRRMDEDGFFK